MSSFKCPAYFGRTREACLITAPQLKAARAWDRGRHCGGARHELINHRRVHFCTRPDGQFRYVPLSSGLDIVRKSLRRHAIAIVHRHKQRSARPPQYTGSFVGRMGGLRPHGTVHRRYRLAKTTRAQLHAPRTCRQGWPEFFSARASDCLPKFGPIATEARATCRLNA
jgi:hypothetical protein